MPSAAAAARVQPMTQLTSDLSKLGAGLVTIEKEVHQIDDSKDKVRMCFYLFCFIISTFQNSLLKS